MKLFIAITVNRKMLQLLLRIQKA